MLFFFFKFISIVQHYNIKISHQAIIYNTFTDNRKNRSLQQIYNTARQSYIFNILYISTYMPILIFDTKKTYVVDAVECPQIAVSYL